MARKSTIWTDERTRKLKVYWQDGLSAQEIVNCMHNEVTRSAVLGIIYRLGLQRKHDGNVLTYRKRKRPYLPRSRDAKRSTSNKRGKKSPSAGQAILPALPCLTREKPLPALNSRVSLIDIQDNECRWPNGDPLDDYFGFCGGIAVEGKPYCSHHCKLAYQGIA